MNDPKAYSLFEAYHESTIVLVRKTLTAVYSIHLNDVVSLSLLAK